MKPGRIQLFVQLGFALMYAAAGLMFLLNPAYQVKMNEPLRIGLGIILLAYAGYRLFAVYKKYSSPHDED